MINYDPKEQPSYHLLICLIEIWNKGDKKPEDLMMPSGKADMMIAEVQSLEIRESYKNVIDTASIKFPRGTVIKKTLESGTIADYGSAVMATREDSGIVVEKRTNSEVAQAANFEIGSRIRIRLGYTTDPKVYNLTKVSAGRDSIYTSNSLYSEYVGHLKIMFEGFITKVSVDTPIELQCQSLTYVLKRITCKKIITGNKTTVKDLLQEPSKKTKGIFPASCGIKIDPNLPDITIGKVQITEDLTVFDVLNQFQRWKIYPYLIWDSEGNPMLTVKRSYTSTVVKEGNDNVLNSTDTPVKIDFNYHVASDGLELLHTEKDFLAVKASCKGKDDKETTFLTIIRNPEYDPNVKGSEAFRVVNEKKISKKAMKKHHIKMVSEGSSKINLSEYTVIEYQSKRIGLTHDQLLDEAIKFYGDYNMNGIEGSLNLFGDLKLKTACIVELYDRRFPLKNGKYLVEEVVTSFGTHGFRQEIKLPYCLERKEPEKNQNNGN